MSRLALGLLLASAAFGLLLPPALAAEAPRSAPVLTAADRAFVASIAAPVRPPAVRERASGRRPGGGVGEKSLCTATANCAFGGTVGCQGNNSCSAVDGNCSWGEVGHVTCDGVTHWCGGSCCPANFCTYEWNCQSSCYPCDYDYTCNWNGCFDDCECRWSTCPI
jgi:hypothetical protein